MRATSATRASPEHIRFVDDGFPGITRRRAGRGWGYWDAEGKRITDREEIDRLNAIALPPAYVDCWFCPFPEGHILAIGYDAKGRKQYRYHPAFRAQRESEKFDAMAEFGRRLPLVRKRVEADLASRGLTRERAVASVVRLLDRGFLRIGNESYAKANGSFGATTLRRRHVKLKGGELRLRFKAKSGKLREYRMTDKSLIRFVKKVQDLPGQHLFQYVNEDGELCHLGSHDVNGYLCKTMGEHFTAKHFRTWHASVIAFQTLAQAKGQVTNRALMDDVSELLGNTPAVARKSYVHPAVVALIDHQAKWRESLQLPRATQWLSRYERALIEHLDAAPSAGELMSGADGSAARKDDRSKGRD